MVVPEAWMLTLTHCDGLFGSRYLPQFPGVPVGCDDDPDEVHWAYKRREAREERYGVHQEGVEDRGDGVYGIGTTLCTAPPYTR